MRALPTRGCGHNFVSAGQSLQRLLSSAKPRQLHRALAVGERPEDRGLPPELQGLRINDQGLLIDEKTGEVINEMTGATRFDVAVRAIRGEFDPTPSVQNTERSSGLLLESLLQFPAIYSFQFVAKPGAGDSQESLLDELRAVVERVCGGEVPREACTVKARLGGKYLSFTVPATVRAADFVERVFKECEGDTRLIMKY